MKLYTRIGKSNLHFGTIMQDSELRELAFTSVMSSLRTLVNSPNIPSLFEGVLSSMDMIFLSELVERDLNIRFSGRHLRLFTKASFTPVDLITVTTSQLKEDMAANANLASQAWKQQRGSKPT